MFPQNKGYLLYLPVFSTFKQEKCYKSKSIYIKFDSLSIFHVFCSKYISCLGDWISRKSVDHANLLNKTFYNNAIISV